MTRKPLIFTTAADHIAEQSFDYEAAVKFWCPKWVCRQVGYGQPDTYYIVRDEKNYEVSRGRTERTAWAMALHTVRMMLIMERHMRFTPPATFCERAACMYPDGTTRDPAPVVNGSCVRCGTVFATVQS